MGKEGGTGDIRVALSEFNKDPKRYPREASTERRVIVFHDGTQQVSASFGGSLNVSPLDDADEVAEARAVPLAEEELEVAWQECGFDERKAIGPRAAFNVGYSLGRQHAQGRLTCDVPDCGVCRHVRRAPE